MKFPRYGMTLWSKPGVNSAKQPPVAEIWWTWTGTRCLTTNLLISYRHISSISLCPLASSYALMYISYDLSVSLWKHKTPSTFFSINSRTLFRHWEIIFKELKGKTTFRIFWFVCLEVISYLSMTLCPNYDFYQAKTYYLYPQPPSPPPTPQEYKNQCFFAFIIIIIIVIIIRILLLSLLLSAAAAS